jgi:hypothetical protein
MGGLLNECSEASSVDLETFRRRGTYRVRDRFQRSLPTRVGTDVRPPPGAHREMRPVSLHYLFPDRGFQIQSSN